MPTTEERLELAEAFLQEAVYRSREKQAAAHVVSLEGASPAEGPGQCGLGKEAAIELDLSERGRELFASLWPGSVESSSSQRIQAIMHKWVEKQDALDRKRNHFMKDFRRTNGFDRTAYDDAQLGEYEAGLAAVNAEADEKRRAAASDLLSID